MRIWISSHPFIAQFLSLTLFIQIGKVLGWEESVIIISNLPVSYYVWCIYFEEKSKVDAIMKITDNKE
jgi:hypothetical protein